jgi:hypothetical protein
MKFGHNRDTRQSTSFTNSKQSEEARSQNASGRGEIQQPACEIHIERGFAHGHDMGDWLQSLRAGGEVSGWLAHRPL